MALSGLRPIPLGAPTVFHVVLLPRFAYWVAGCFSKSTFSKCSFKNTISVLNGLDLDQARRFVGPDLGLNKVFILQEAWFGMFLL